MKNITTKTEKTRTIYGGLGILEAITIVGGAAMSVEWAIKTGYSWGTAIGKKIFKK